MNRIIKTALVSITLITFFSCKKDVLPTGVFVKIEAVQNISIEGATFSANILNSDNLAIYDYGFVWSDISDAPVSNDFKYAFGNSTKSVKFNHNITGGLIEGITYYVRAYARIDNFLIYSNSVSFTSQGSSPPIISDFTPTSGGHDTKIKISGRNFINNPQKIRVKFGNLIALVDSSTESEIYVTSPDVVTSDSVKISVEIAQMTDTSRTYFNLYYPWAKNKYINIPDGSCNFSANNHCYFIKPYSSDISEWSPENSKIFIGLPETSGAAPLCTAKDNFAYILLNGNLYQFNFNSSEFIKLTHLEDGILNPKDMFIVNNDIFIGNIESKYLVKFNLTGKTWEPRSPFAFDENKYYSSILSCNNKAYILSGDYITGSFDIYEYKSESDTWIYITQSLYATGWWANNLVIDNKLYFDIGYDINEYDPASDTWKQYINCPVSYNVRYSFVCGNRGYVIFENPNGSDLKLSWEFDPSKN